LPDDEPTAGEFILVTFSDGGSRSYHPQSEILLVTDEGIEAVFVSSLKPGDQVAVFEEMSTKSIFDSILARVNHLVGADQQVISLWRNALHEVLSQHPLRSGQLLVRLRQLGCRRADQTIRTWFIGTTMAPRDAADIARILQLAQFARPEVVARLISREVEVIRSFNRRLGKRIHGQIRAAATGGVASPKERLDFEIDEAIEALEYKEVQRVWQSA
jgi:hypothetical protein